MLWGDFTGLCSLHCSTWESWASLVPSCPHGAGKWPVGSTMFSLSQPMSRKRKGTPLRDPGELPLAHLSVCQLVPIPTLTLSPTPWHRSGTIVGRRQASQPCCAMSELLAQRSANIIKWCLFYTFGVIYYNAIECPNSKIR